MEAALLPRFFDRVTRQVFGDLILDDPPAVRYIADLLTRFARTDTLYRAAPVSGRRLETVAHTLIEVQRAWDPDAPDFAPERELALRRHIGDFTLFMSGIFRDHVERIAVLALYETEGRRAYRFVSEMARARGEAEAPLYRRLSDGFERFAGALTYMRKVYFRDGVLPFRGPDDGQLLRIVSR